MKLGPSVVRSKMTVELVQDTELYRVKVQCCGMSYFYVKIATCVHCRRGIVTFFVFEKAPCGQDVWEYSAVQAMEGVWQTGAAGAVRSAFNI
jgi:hypothetical protein